MAIRVSSVDGFSLRLMSEFEFSSKANFPSLCIKLMLLPLVPSPACSVTTNVEESPNFARISERRADLSFGTNKILHFVSSLTELIRVTWIVLSPTFFFPARVLSSDKIGDSPRTRIRKSPTLASSGHWMYRAKL